MKYRLTQSNGETYLEITEMRDNGHNEQVPFTILFIRGQDKIRELLEVLKAAETELR